MVTISNYAAPLCNYKIIEFNSWETNCGAAPFDWQDDSDILYPVIKPLSSTRSTIFRTITSAVTGQSNQPDYQIYQDDYGTTVGCYTAEVRDPRFRDLEVTQDCPLAKYPDNYVEITPETILTPLPHQPGKAVLAKIANYDYLYLASDIYLYRWELRPVGPSGYTVKARNWVRGVFRFHDVIINPANNIEAGGKVYHYDLTPLPQVKTSRKAVKTVELIDQSRNQLADQQYGFAALDQTGREIFVRISSTGQLYVLT